MHDLEIATAILKEFMELEMEKQERQSRNKVDQKAVAQAAAQKVDSDYFLSQRLLNVRNR